MENIYIGRYVMMCFTCVSPFLETGIMKNDMDRSEVRHEDVGFELFFFISFKYA